MSLLDKFRNKKRKSDLRDDILEHLSDLLNTKKGYGSYSQDLGLDSYVYLGSDNKISLHIIEDIKTCFEKYEKRVNQLEIIPMESKSRFHLSFVIKCQIKNKPYSFHLDFQCQNKSYHIEAEE